MVDLQTGFTLASAQRPGASLDEDRVKAVLQSGENLFRGKLIQQFVQSLPIDRTSAGGFVREVHITRAYTYQFMAAMPGWESGVLILVTEKTLSLGMGWMAVHQALAQLVNVRRETAHEPPLPPPEPLSERTAPPAAETPIDTRTERRAVRPTAPSPAGLSAPPRAEAARAPAPADRAPIAHESAMPPVPVPEPAPPPPVEQPPAASVVPNPRVTTERARSTADAGSDAPATNDDPPLERPVVAGPRARMFRPKTNKNKKR